MGDVHSALLLAFCVRASVCERSRNEIKMEKSNSTFDISQLRFSYWTTAQKSAKTSS